MEPELRAEKPKLYWLPEPEPKLRIVDILIFFLRTRSISGKLATHYPDSKFQNAVRIQIQIYMTYGTPELTIGTMLTKETGKGFT